MDSEVKKTQSTKAKKPATTQVFKKEVELKDEILDGLSEIAEIDTPSTEIDFEDKCEEVDLLDTTLIDVKSLRFGGLTFKGRDGTTRWGKFGEVQTLTMKELRDMKNISPRFYEERWIIPIGVSKGSRGKAKPADIFEQLSIRRYYKSYIDPSPKEIIKWGSKEVLENTALISGATKDNLIVGLNAYIDKRVLTDLNIIDAWEKALNCKLTRGN